jgi:hypothetical protein
MRHRPSWWLSAVALVGLIGCGAEDGQGGVRRFTLSGEIGPSQGLVLATGAIVDVYFDEHGESDIFLQMGMSMVLTGPADDQPFCAKGADFADVAEIPTATAGCFWDSVSLYPNTPFEDAERSITGQGYLVRARDDRLYRLLVVEHSISESYVGTVTFDVLAAD